MKKNIYRKIKDIKEEIIIAEINFKNLEENIINLRMYSTKYPNLVRKIIHLSNEFENLKPEIEKIEEATCRLLQKWQ